MRKAGEILTPLGLVCPKTGVRIAESRRGVPFNWAAHFCAIHHRNPEGSGGGTGPRTKDTPIVLFFKSLQAGERWITVNPNGPDEKGQPILIQNAL
jgi:hypothetical protein